MTLVVLIDRVAAAAPKVAGAKVTESRPGLAGDELMVEAPLPTTNSVPGVVVRVTVAAWLLPVLVTLM